MKYHHVRILCLGAAVSAMLSGAAAGQNRRPVRVSEFFASPTCSEEIGSSSADSLAARLSYVSYLRNADECAAAPPDRWRSKREEPSATPPALLARDSVEPVENEFLRMGSAGLVIAAARQHVILILREHNSCSAWYAQAEPDPFEKFSSLHFHVDSEGEDTTFGDYSSAGLYYREPYVARAQQEVGAGSTITLNAHGGFFQWSAPVKIRWQGGPLLQQPPRPLRVGIYSGNSLNGQVTTLLHEFAHVVGLVPIDSGERDSAMISTQNTDIVLHHCRKQIGASVNRTIMLPESLAELERLARPAGN